MPYDIRRPTAAEIAHHVAEIAAQGFSVIEDVIPKDFLDDIFEELDRLEKLRPGGDVPPAPFTGRVTRRWFDLLNEDDVWIDVATNPALLPILEKVLGPDFLLSTMASAIIAPGEAAQRIHADSQPYRMRALGRPMVCNTMWALSGFTDENGATRLVPGSNRWSEEPLSTADSEPPQHETIPLEMPAGSVGFVLGTTYHGAGANRSSQERQALTINYCSGAVRQQENYMLSVHPARLLTFPSVLQDLLGFRLWSNLGHVFGSDPRRELSRRYQPDPSAGRGDRAQRNCAWLDYLAAKSGSAPKATASEKA